ncbi:MAG: hypothetical protein OEZ14_04535 [Acidimicrobiia bacterium]|nr:hypothetical protein [Acidimicrobiia bacterium]MDH5519784.1 hypothetical protein [Acidimicrobiia bacterium]
MTHAIAELRIMFRAAVALRSRPDLWSTAIGSYRSLVPNRWWRSRPFLPLPDADWLRFRLVTAYGGDGSGVDGGIAPDDLVLWLEWRRAWPG